MEWYILALISALFSALAAVLEKKILFKEKVIEFTFILALFNAVLASIFLFFTDFTKITTISLIILLFKAVLNSFAFLFVMHAIKDLELSSALPLLVLTPGLVAVFAFFFLGETLNWINISGLVILTIGIYILNLKDVQNLTSPFTIFFNSRGHKFITLALLFFTITSLIDRFLLTRGGMPPTALMSFQHFFFCIFFLIILIISRPNLTQIKDSLRKILITSGILIFLLSIVTIVYRYTEILSVKGTKNVALSLILKRISVFFAIIIGGKMFNEHHLLRKIIATIILIAGAILVVI